MRTKRILGLLLGFLLLSTVAFALTMTQEEFDAKYKGTGTTPSGENASGSTGLSVPPAPVSKAPVSTSSSNSLGDFKPGSEPGGFGDINWGIDIHTLSGMEYVTTDTSFWGVRIWTKKNDELKIGSATLDKILYSFWLGEFNSVKIYTKGSVDWAYLQDATFEKFGKGYQDNKYLETYEWFGKTTSMVLKYDEISKIGFLYMRSTEIAVQQTEYDKQKVKEGAKRGF